MKGALRFFQIRSFHKYESSTIVATLPKDSAGGGMIVRVGTSGGKKRLVLLLSCVHLGDLLAGPSDCGNP